MAIGNAALGNAALCEATCFSCGKPIPAAPVLAESPTLDGLFGIEVSESEAPLTSICWVITAKGTHRWYALLNQATYSLVRPLPVHNIGTIDAMFVGVVGARNLLIFEHFFYVSTGNLELGNSVNHIDRNAKAINLVLDCQI